MLDKYLRKPLGFLWKALTGRWTSSKSFSLMSLRPTKFCFTMLPFTLIASIFLVSKSFLNFSQSTAVWLPCSVKNLRRIRQLKKEKKKLWTNEILWHFSSRCILDRLKKNISWAAGFEVALVCSAFCSARLSRSGHEGRVAEGYVQTDSCGKDGMIAAWVIGPWMCCVCMIGLFQMCEFLMCQVRVVFMIIYSMCIIADSIILFFLVNWLLWSLRIGTKMLGWLGNIEKLEIIFFCLLACLLVGAKPTHQPLLTCYQLDPWEQTPV